MGECEFRSVEIVRRKVALGSRIYGSQVRERERTCGWPSTVLMFRKNGRRILGQLLIIQLRERIGFDPKNRKLFGPRI